MTEAQICAGLDKVAECLLYMVVCC